MALLERFWNTLLDNVVLMMVMLPLVGAVLVLLSARLGVEHIRRTALTNVALTFLLSLLMVGHYDTEAASRGGTGSDVQMTSVFRWFQFTGLSPESQNESAAAERNREETAGSFDVRFALGVDGISIWPVALAALVMIPVVVTGHTLDHKHPAAFYALLLVEQTTVFGLLTAIDVVLFCLFLQLTLIPMFFLIGIWGGYQRRQVVGKFLLCNLAGGLLITVALLSVVLVDAGVRAGLTPSSGEVVGSFSIPRLTSSFPALIARSGATEYWNIVGPWVFAALVAGVAIRAAVFPVHSWFLSSSEQAPPPAGLLLAGLLAPTALYVLARFAAGLFSLWAAESAPLLQGIVIAGVIYFGLAMQAVDDVRQVLGYACLCAWGLCAAGILTLSPAGMTGGLLHLWGTGLSICVALVALGSLAPGARTKLLVSSSRHNATTSWLTTCARLSVLSLVGLPGLAGFAGTLMTLLGIFPVNPWAAVGGMVGWLLVVRALVRLLGRIRWESFGPARDNPLKVAVLIPLMAVIVWIGLFPQFFIRTMEPSVARALGTVPPEQDSQIGQSPPTGIIQASGGREPADGRNNSSRRE